MKSLLTLSMVAVLATLTLIQPAHAQFRGGWGGGNASINATQSLLQSRINQGIQNGRLSPKEAATLQAKLSKISALEARMRASGNRVSRSERNRLEQQLSDLSAQITRDLNDYDHRRVGYWNFKNKVNGNGYGNGYGNGNGYGRGNHNHWD